MNILELQELLERLVKLIEHECTGTPTELGQRLGVTDRTVKRYIAQLRDMGADIKYCSRLNSYYFASPVDFRFGFEPLDDTDGNSAITGGGGNGYKMRDIAIDWFALVRKNIFFPLWASTRKLYLLVKYKVTYGLIRAKACCTTYNKKT